MAPTHHSSPDHDCIPNEQPIDFFADSAAQLQQGSCDYDKLIGKRRMPIDFFGLESQGSEDASLTQLTLGGGPPPSHSHTKKKKKKSSVSGAWLQLAPPLRDPNDEIDYEIIKVLRASDVDGSSRLLLEKSVAEKHILAHVVSMFPHFDVFKGVEVGVFDVDTSSNHLLVFKKWASTGSFVLGGKWVSDFVKRRGLKVNDEIGLRWNPHHSKLEFKVLKNN